MDAGGFVEEFLETLVVSLEEGHGLCVFEKGKVGMCFNRWVLVQGLMAFPIRKEQNETILELRQRNSTPLDILCSEGPFDF